MIFIHIDLLIGTNTEAPRVPVKCEAKRNIPKRNEIHRSETKFTETRRNRIIQNEIKTYFNEAISLRKDKTKIK